MSGVCLHLIQGAALEFLVLIAGYEISFRATYQPKTTQTPRGRSSAPIGSRVRLLTHCISEAKDMPVLPAFQTSPAF